MSDKILSLTCQDQTVQIRLLDNLFVNKWANQLAKVLAGYSYQYFFGSWPFIRSLNQTQLEQHATALSQVVTQLREFDVGFPESFDVSETHSLDLELQKKLNRLHRYFTWFNRDDIEGQPSWGPDCPVTGNKDSSTLEKIRHLTHRVNVEVHRIEGYVTTPNKMNLMSEGYSELAIEFDIDRDPSVSSEMLPGVWKYMEPEDFHYLSNDPQYDVWLPNQILGKPYIVAYYDHDDPTEWDITHQIGYSGNFVVGIEGNKARHMNHPDVVNWLRQYGIEPGPTTCGMPLGQIISGRDYLEPWMNNRANLGQLTIKLDCNN